MIDADSHVAERLRAMRKQAGLSLEEISRRLGISTSSYRHWEERHKAGFIRQDMVLKLLEVLRGEGIPETDILALGGMDKATAMQEPPADYSPAARGKRLIDQLEARGTEDDLRMGTDGKHIQIIATVDRAGLDRLIKRLQVMRELLD